MQQLGDLLEDPAAATAAAIDALLETVFMDDGDVDCLLQQASQQRAGRDGIPCPCVTGRSRQGTAWALFCYGFVNE